MVSVFFFFFEFLDFCFQFWVRCFQIFGKCVCSLVCFSQSFVFSFTFSSYFLVFRSWFVGGSRQDEDRTLRSRGLKGICATQESEWEEGQRVRTEELVVMTLSSC